MKAFIIFNDNTEQTVKGKDIRLHRDGPGDFHLTDAYKNHRTLAAFANVREIAMQGKPKQAKQKAPTVETLKITVDTTELTAGLKAAIVEIEDLVQQGQLVNRADVAIIERTTHTDERHTPMPNPTDDDLNDPVFNAIFDVIKSWDVNSPQHYHGYCSANGSHAKLILDALRLNPESLAGIIHRRDELLRGLNRAYDSLAEHNTFRTENPGAVDQYQIGVANGLRTALGDFTGSPVEILARPQEPVRMPIGETGIAYLSEGDQTFIKAQTLASGETVIAGIALGVNPADVRVGDTPIESAPMPVFAEDEVMPTPTTCTCPLKRNIIERGHLSYCPSYEGKADCEAQPVKE